jgi:DNA-directed RNA polymerase subunit M/transcription elongation factor TFIIS
MQATLTNSEYAMACPHCGSQEIRMNQLVEAIHLVAVEPITGKVMRGRMMDTVDTEVNPIYACRQCQYESVIPSMFVKEVVS